MCPGSPETALLKRLALNRLSILCVKGRFITSSWHLSFIGTKVMAEPRDGTCCSSESRRLASPALMLPSRSWALGNCLEWMSRGGLGATGMCLSSCSAGCEAGSLPLSITTGRAQQEGGSQAAKRQQQVKQTNSQPVVWRQSVDR